MQLPSRRGREGREAGQVATCIVHACVIVCVCVCVCIFVQCLTGSATHTTTQQNITATSCIAGRIRNSGHPVRELLQAEHIHTATTEFARTCGHPVRVLLQAEHKLTRTQTAAIEFARTCGHPVRVLLQAEHIHKHTNTQQLLISARTCGHPVRVLLQAHELPLQVGQSCGLGIPALNGFLLRSLELADFCVRSLLGSLRTRAYTLTLVSTHGRVCKSIKLVTLKL